jgi:hypothetical protein
VSINIGKSQILTTGTQWYLNVWTHIVGIKTGTTAIIYVNGVEVKRGTVVSGASNNTNPNIGLDSYYPDWLIKRVMVFNRACSPQEILAMSKWA